ncbi:MAG: GC-type dockerin domain-anchored protein, partial [Gemmatimonadales bacterium]
TLPCLSTGVTPDGAFTASCPADCDGSGSLDAADLACFQALFAQDDPEADCNGDGTLSIADFICFQDRYAAGCP